MTSGAAPFHELMGRLVAEGGLLPRHPEVLTLEFMGPLLLWRHLHAIQPDGPLIENRSAFVRDHVSHFLQGATARPVPNGIRTARKHVARRRARAQVAP